jgi:hypothetical protein
LTTDEDHFVNVCGLQLRVFECRQARLNRLIDEIFHERFELFSRERLVEVLGTVGVGSDERQIDVRLSSG